MTKDNLSCLPIWKKNETAAEFMSEVETLARIYPQRFGKAVVICEETLPNGHTKIRLYRHNVVVNEAVGIIEIAKLDLIDEART